MTEQQPLIRGKAPNENSKEEFIKEALKSECASNIDSLLKGKDPPAVERLKYEMFEKIYETMGSELEPEDLARALVVRNERFGTKLVICLSVITLGLFLLFRPRDDDMVLVMTKNGTLVKLKVDRAPCCPRTPNAALLVFLRYVAILFGLLVMPNLAYMIISGKSFEEELHDLHLDTEGYKDIPALLKRNYPVTIFTLAVLGFWLCSLMPHDYRDRHRRRHTARELAVGQFTLSGSSCRRRSSFRLYFGKYPSQLMLDIVGNLDLGRATGPIPPAELSATQGLNASTIIVGLTLFLSFVTGVDTFFAWMDRSIALEHFAKMQKFCIEAPAEKAQCTPIRCEKWAVQDHIGVSTTFCSQVEWSEEAQVCKKFGREPPCCGGCSHGGFLSTFDEGFLATLKSSVSLVADTGTILCTLLAARYALSLATATDNIDVLIKRRSKNAYSAEIANFDMTIPLALDLLDAAFSKARTHSMENRSQQRKSQAMDNAPPEDGDDGKWCGVRNFVLDDETQDWNQFFHEDLLAPPDTRWTARLRVPRRCLGIGEEEEVLGAWVELPLLPPPISVWEFMMGGLWYALLPFGKTRHAIIVTDQRLFYVRHRRPSLPLKFLGTDLRMDVFRHDHDVIYGRMDRTKLSFANRLVHQKLLFENFLPGRILMQTKFGALEINRFHGDALDVYHLISRLSRNTSGFINRQEIEATGVVWERCQEQVRRSLTRKGAVWQITPQPDDRVAPVPDIYLGDIEKEQVVFHLTFKDLGSFATGTYTNTDVVITTGRIFFWSRKAYKNFDCQALPCWCCCWLGCLNPIFAARNLPNSMSFFSLPSILSFSTDLSVDPTSWLVPHHTPLKVPCIERCCAILTRRVTRNSAPPPGSTSWSCLPRRSGASARLLLMWRLKQSAHADEDMLVLFTIRPHLLEDEPEEDTQDVYEGLGFITDKAEDAGQVMKDHEEKVETLRKIMCVVQDACHRLLDKVDDLV